MSRSAVRGVWSGLVALLVLLTLQFIEPRNGLALERTDSLRKTVICGPNAVFMFLVLCRVDLEEGVIDQIECGNRGASLLQLRDFCNAHGLSTEVRRFDFREERMFPIPAILQTRAQDQSHFCVAYRIDADGVQLLDGTTGHKMYVRHGRMAGFFSGYALLKGKTLKSRILDLWTLSHRLLVGLNFGLVAWLLFGNLKNRRSARRYARQ